MPLAPAIHEGAVAAANDGARIEKSRTSFQPAAGAFFLAEGGKRTGITHGRR